MKLRIAITIGVLFLYDIAFNFYIYELLRVPHRNAALLYNYITLGMLVFCVTDWKLGFVNAFHSQFNFVCFLSLIVNYVLIILTHHQFLTSPVYMFLAFNSGVFAVTMMVFVSGIRHKFFK